MQIALCSVLDAGEKGDAGEGQIGGASPFILLPRLVQVKLGTNSAVHCRREKMGDLSRTYNSFGLDSFPLDCI